MRRSSSRLAAAGRHDGPGDADRALQGTERARQRRGAGRRTADRRRRRSAQGTPGRADAGGAARGACQAAVAATGTRSRCSARSRSCGRASSTRNTSSSRSSATSETKTGVARPNYDPSLDAMQPALARAVPVAFEAELSREILRALDMAKEFKLDPVITGAREADQVVRRPEGAERAGHLQPQFPRRARARWRPTPTSRFASCAPRAQAPKTPGGAREGGRALRVLVGHASAAARFRPQRGARRQGRAARRCRGPRADDQRGEDRRRRRSPRLAREGQDRQRHRHRRRSVRGAHAESSTSSSTAGRWTSSLLRLPRVAAAAAAARRAHGNLKSSERAFSERCYSTGRSGGREDRGPLLPRVRAVRGARSAPSECVEPGSEHALIAPRVRFRTRHTHSVARLRRAREQLQHGRLGCVFLLPPVLL